MPAAAGDLATPVAGAPSSPGDGRNACAGPASGQASDRAHGIGCALILAAAYLATWPFTDTGVLDDWSFARTALDLSRTGELRYNGWAAPMIGAQAYLGAASARLLGETLTAVRVSMLPLAVLTSLTLRALLRRAGVPVGLASLGALVFGTSPVIVPLAVSFMTDLPAVLGALVCALAILRAGEAPTSSGAIIWLSAAAVAGGLGGSVRQTSWLAPLVMLPWAALRRRHQPMVAMAALGLTAISGILAWTSDRWLAAQPFVSRLEPLGDLFTAVRQGSPLALGRLVPLLSTASLLLLPLVWGWIAAVAGILDAPTRRRLGLAIAVATSLAISLVGWLGSAPWMSNMLTPQGLVGPGVTVLGDGPTVLTPAVRTLLALATYAGLLLVPVVHFASRNAGADPALREPVGSLLGWFSVLYGVGLALRTVQAGGFDRYLAPLLPWLILALLRRWPSATAPGGRAATRLAATLAGLWGVYAVAITHDLLATLRARGQSFAMLVDRGIAPTAICGGFEIDGSTEIDASGAIANPLVDTPPEARARFRHRTDLPVRFWFLDHTPRIEPQWWITLSEVPGLSDSGLLGAEFVTWLPPQRRRIRILASPRESMR